MDRQLPFRFWILLWLCGVAFGTEALTYRLQSPYSVSKPSSSLHTSLIQKLAISESRLDSENVTDSENPLDSKESLNPKQTLELSPLPSLDPNPHTYKDKIENPQWGNAAKNEPPNPFSFPKDGSYYLEAYAPMLRDFVRQVREQSERGEYPRYSSRPLIEYSAYKRLKNADRAALRGAIVLISGYLSEFIKYSNFGGVGVGMKHAQNDEKSFYLSFDGRYFTDLESFGLGKEIFAYCVLPRFDKCILLGIGEEW